MKGFFSSSSLTSKPQAFLLPQCGACGLYKQCQSPKMKVSGEGKKGILIFGEAPGRNEDKQGKQFVGESGQLLEAALRKAGINMRKDCWLSNSLICRPPNNDTPTDKQIEYCRPNLTNTLKELKPRIIIPLGSSAVKSVVGGFWKESVGKIGNWVGWKIPNQTPNCWICPNWHPSYLLRQDKKRDDGMLQMFFERYLEEAVNLKGVPWEEVPNFKSRVVPIMEDEIASREIRRFIKRGKPVAFDYETNCLKPDGDVAEIVCCSISDGETTIAYPWQGDAIPSTRELLRSLVKKVGSNIKFEERWTRAKLGCRVRNWMWDTMLAAHWMDNREGITSIKFQAYVMLGQTEWNQHLEKLLESKVRGGNNLNRVKEIDIKDLLVYCGMDSLLEFKVAMKQMKLAGVKV